jgi:hypothetical protein
MSINKRHPKVPLLLQQVAGTNQEPNRTRWMQGAGGRRVRFVYTRPTATRQTLVMFVFLHAHAAHVAHPTHAATRHTAAS